MMMRRVVCSSIGAGRKEYCMSMRAHSSSKGVAVFSETSVGTNNSLPIERKEFKDVRGLHDVAPGEKVWVRGSFKENSKKDDVAYQTSYAEYLANIQRLPKESLVEVYGVVVPARVKSCSQQKVEVHIEELRVVSRSASVLPFNMNATLEAVTVRGVGGGQEPEDDSDAVDVDATAQLNSDVVSQAVRLNNRWLDLRNPANNAIMRIQAAVGQLFREFMYTNRFCEIHSPKLVAGASEGGADVFTVGYFDKQACLAQSPQLYKQMAIASDMHRVFEVGPVFRAEQSHTRRHLCEFTGLDLEMEISSHYSEVLVLLHGLFKYMFAELESPRFAREMAAIRAVYPSAPAAITDEPLVVPWGQAMDMLANAGVSVGPLDDLTGAAELRLGELVKEKYSSDFFILDQYPSRIRPFYTMMNPDDDRYSNSYDLFIRGQEICSGAQRCHDVHLLREQIAARGLNPDHFKSYLSAFQYGMSPHGGAGIGLERVVFLYLGLDNVRKASLFPRTPRRLTP